MVSNVCNRVTSYFSNLNTPDRVISLGAAGLGLYLGGIASMIIAAGGYLAMRAWDDSSKPKVVKQVQPQPEPKSSHVGKQELKEEGVGLGSSIRLRRSAETPPSITNHGNCCFLSAILWGIFLNEPVILDEIPKAIQRRLEKGLFVSPLDQIVPHDMSDEKRNALIKVGTLLSDGKPMKQLQFLTLCRDLQTLEKDGGFPVGMNVENANELLSLLELYSLINACQLSDDPIPGARINELRKAIKRVRSTFAETGTQTGDAHEAFMAFTDLIFEGSKRSRDLITKRVVFQRWWKKLQDEVGTQTGEVNPLPEKNWGHFEIAVSQGGSIQKALDTSFKETIKAKYRTTWSSEKKEFTVDQSIHFSEAPELLVLTVKRYEDPNAIVDAEEFLTIPQCLDGRSGRYQLMSVVNRHGASANSYGHYTAHVRAGGEALWFYCNDVGTVVEPTHETKAQTGYILVYRKIG